MKFIGAVQETVDDAIAREDEWLAAQGQDRPLPGKTIMPHRKILQEFERRLEISPRQHDRGPVTFDLQGLGSLTPEASGDESELIATLAAPLPPYDDSAHHRRALFLVIV